MNIEVNKSTEDNGSKEKNILSQNLIDFTVKDYLRPFLSENPDNPFISPSTASKLKQVIPGLIGNLLTSVENNLEENELSIGGSSMEVFAGLISPEYYWKTKQNFIDLLSAKHEIIKDAGQILTVPLRTLAFGDCDLDLYIKDSESLDKIFDKFHDNYHESEVKQTVTGGRQFQVTLPDSDINLTVYAGPMQKDSSRKRLFFRLKDNRDTPLFHIDITNRESFGNQAFDRRKGVGSIHDNCQGKIDVHSGTVSIDKNIIPKPNEPSSLQLAEKDIKTIPETVMREMRKKLFHLAFNKEANKNISIYQLFPLIKPDDIFYLRELTSDPKYHLKETVENLSIHQKDTLYRELFLMASVDPYLTVLFLQDTGFDSLFLGRHLSRREGLRILSSPWLKIENSNDYQFTKTGNVSVENINQSRQEFISLKDKNPNQNGFMQFASAIGHVFGDNSQDFESHFKNGLNILENPGKIPVLKQPVENMPSNELLQEMYRTIVSRGSLTERSLHSILNKKDPEKFPNKHENDLKSFKYNFFKLKTSGLLEVAKRKIETKTDSIDVDFYYPSSSNRDILSLMPFVESDSQTDLSPNVPEYWKKLSKRSTKLSKIEPKNLSQTWRFLTLVEIESMEALLAVNKFDIEMMNNLLSNLIHTKPNYEDFEVLRGFLISKQTEINQSWFDPQLNI